MKSFRLADLTVNFEPAGKAVITSRPFQIPDCDAPDMVLKVTPEDIQRARDAHPALSPDFDWSYVLLGHAFSTRLLDYDGFVLHASAVVKEDKAFLFSADPDTGKSTHTRLWTEVFPDAAILNDDKPAIRFVDNTFYAYGTPFCGSTWLTLDRKVPLRAVCFLSRGTRNEIERMTSPAEILPLLLNQTVQNAGRDRIGRLLTLFDRLLRDIPFYRLSCLPDAEAALLAWNAMK